FDDAGDLTLQPGESTLVNVSFAPRTTGAHAATLEVFHTGLNSPLSIPLSGTGIDQSQPGVWQTRAPSGPARQEVAYVQLGNKFYLSGGSTAHEVYDPASDSWANLTSLPENLDHVQAVALGGKIYYIGGLESWPAPASTQVYIYDPTTNSFSQGAPMARPRGAGGAAVYQGKIYYGGGLNSGSAVSWFDVYDPMANTWTPLPDMPANRDHFHAAVVGNKFYVTAGRDTAINATVASTITFDFTAGTWQTGLAPIPTPRGGFGAAVLGTEILVIGGEGGGNTYSNVEAYDTATNTWRTLAPMPTARHGIQAAECNGGVYIAAGGLLQGDGQPVDAHEVFFLNTPTPCASSPPPTIGFGKSTLQGGSSTHPTSLQFGPDGRLYVAHQTGLIKAYTVVRNGVD
ncbi:MAG: Kelch repeat-containing protein, partial [Gemmatimonadales bacterium]